MPDDDRHRGPWQPNGHSEAEDSWVEGGGARATDPLANVRRGIDVYHEMLSFEQEMLNRMRRWARNRPEWIRLAVEASDIEPMEALIEQFRERLIYWQERERQLRQD